MTFWTSELVSSLNSSPTRVVMAIVPIRNEKTTFYWIICYLMTFWKCDITSSLLSSPTRVVMAIVPIWNHQKNFYSKICYLMTFWKCDITSSLLSSPTRVVMAIVPIWNHQKNFLLNNMLFNDILKVWHHFVTSFVTNTRSYGHSSNLESSKKLFI